MMCNTLLEKTSRIKKDICIEFTSVTSKMQSQKTDQNYFAMNKIPELLIYEHIYSTRIMITLFIDWQTYCLSFAQLNTIDSME